MHVADQLFFTFLRLRARLVTNAFMRTSRSAVQKRMATHAPSGPDRVDLPGQNTVLRNMMLVRGLCLPRLDRDAEIDKKDNCRQ
jgi:hypothetical protein